MTDSGAVEQQARRRERRALTYLAVATVVVLIGCGVAGGLLVSALDDDPGGRDLGPIGLVIVIAVPAVVVLAGLAIVLGFLWWRRRRGSALFARSPLWELPDRRERNALVKALRRGDPIAPERRELARRVARDMVGRRGLIWIYVALTVIAGANFALQPDPFRWVQIFVAAVFLFCAGYFGRLIHRMRLALQRLDTDPAQDV